MTTFTTLCSFAWYAAQGTEWMRMLYRAGGNRSLTIMALIWVGLALFVGLVWVLYRRPPWSLSKETWIVILSSWILFSLLWMFGRSSSFRTWFGYRPPLGGIVGLQPIFFFVTCSLLLRSIVPVAIIRGVFKKEPNAFGYRLAGSFKEWWWYGLATGVIVLIVFFFASEQPAFLKKYPWCKRAILDGQISITSFALYGLAAFVFFFSGESFWRGYLLLGTHRELGPISIFLMVNIYVFGHFGKPLLETLGAVFAGLFLGALALKHRTFLLGAVCHWIVAMSMDLSALYRRGVEWTF